MPLDLHETARRAGGASWLDARLFEVLGDWVHSTPEPEVKIALATQSSHHGWHATLWADRLPTLHDVEPASWVGPPSAGVQQAVGLLAGATTTIERLAGLHRALLPRLLAAHAGHLEAASPVADAPTIRTLRLVMLDEAEDQRTGERLLQGLLRTRPDVERAAARQAVVEAVLAESGPLLGAC
ncbi:MAG: hypothetical protein WKF86_06265 [Acidimicrobiales bacterium]